MFRFSDYRKPKVIKVPKPPAVLRSDMAWPLRVSIKDGNKEVLATRRAEKLDRAIEALTTYLEEQRLIIDPVEADGIGISLAELHLRMEKLQQNYFNGDGRSKRKHRGKKKDGSITDLLK